MNCLEFRRQLGIDPRCRDSAFLAHRDSCPACAAACARALAFDADLERAMARAVPEGLADRIVLAQTTAERVAQTSAERAAPARRLQRGRRLAAALALAASLVLVVFGVHRGQQRATPLVDLVLEHVLHHEPHATESRIALGNDVVGAAFASRGVPLVSMPEGISYVHECPVGPYRTVHMVMPEGDGAVSVVYVADPDRRDRRESTRGGMRALEVPMGNGALVMVAADTRGFERIEKAWRAAVDVPGQTAPVTQAAAHEVSGARVESARFAAP